MINNHGFGMGFGFVKMKFIYVVSGWENVFGCWVCCWENVFRWSEFIRVRELREGWVRGFSFRIFSS